MNWLVQILRYGYGIVPGIINVVETRSLLEELCAAGLPRSRAGIRHVMKLPEVSRIAYSESMLAIVKPILGAGRDSLPSHLL